MMRPADFIVRIRRADESAPGRYIATVVDAPLFLGRELCREFDLEVDDIARYYCRCVPQRPGEGLTQELARQKAHDLGKQIFDSLFADEMKEYYFESLYTMRGRSGLCLHVWLEAEELSRLPWEYLSFGHMDMDEQAPCPIVIRSMPSTHSPRRAEQMSGQMMEIVVATANPGGFPPLNLEQEWQFIENTRRARRVRIVGRRGLNRRDLENLPERFCIFYFSGHGEVDERSDESVLVLQDGSKISADELLRYLILDGNPRCRFVMLNACHSAQIAERLVRAGIPGACGMAGKWPEWPQAIALKFAEGFWRGLRETGVVEVAVEEGRRCVTSSRPELAASVRLYGSYAESRPWYIRPAGMYDVREDLRRFVQEILQPARRGKGSKRILMIRDRDGAGKSFLLQKMAEQCKKSGDCAVLVDWEEFKKDWEKLYGKSHPSSELTERPEIYLARYILERLGDRQADSFGQEYAGRSRLSLFRQNQYELRCAFWERLQAIVEERVTTGQVVVLLFDRIGLRGYEAMEDWLLWAVCVPLNEMVRAGQAARGLAVVIAGRNSLFTNHEPINVANFRGQPGEFWEALHTYPELSVSRLSRDDIREWICNKFGPNVNERMLEDIHRQTEGLPGLIVSNINRYSSYYELVQPA